RAAPTLLIAAAVAPLALAPPVHAGADAAAAVAPSFAPSFAIEHYRLDNGLEVILHRDPLVTTCVVHVWYHVGSKDEVAGRTGFAHLFEHLMFEGSRHVPEGQFDQLLEAAGGWNNGSTDTDRTNYYEQLPASSLALALWLEADRMAGLWDAMSQDVLDNQRDVVKNERRQSYENQPYGRAQLEVDAALWPEGHPYHHPTIGSMADLSAATLDDVEAFWRTWYRPSNATLVIAGGIDLDATRALVARYFGWMPRQDRPAGVTLDGPVTPRPGAVALQTTDQVQAPKVIVAWRTDAPYTEAATNLEVAAQLLGGGKTSRLYRRLVFEDRLASEVYAFQSDALLGGSLEIHAIARDGVTIEQVRDAIYEEVARLRDDGVAADELERATRVLEASRLGGLENLASRAEAIAEWAADTGDPDHLAEEQALLHAVTPTTLARVLPTWLADDAAVTILVRPEVAP
ncbi:MAG: insulinase family protein, partial [Myxococcales bacterium]|nr:insulinase family protein [Myxococcales bacterium]